MQVTDSPSTKIDVFSSSVYNRVPTTRKASLRDAFRWLPVFLALLLSSLCITFLLNIQPAGAASSKTISQSKAQSNKPDYIPNIPTSDERKISSVFTKEVSFWEKNIIVWAENHQLDPNFVAVVMQIESCGHPSIRSLSGANGLFQVMPFHFSPDENPVHPDTNAYRGLTYLAGSLALAENDPALALAGYNGGHSVIRIDPTYWADETQRYVYWGSGILSDISSGYTQSPRLEEWLSAGGESLCNLSANALGL